MTEETEAETEELVVTSRFDCLDDDQFLRLYIFDHYADHEGAAVIKDMEAIFKWIKHGKPNIKEVT